jgi:very-short-patch-repair endonuclease
MYNKRKITQLARELRKRSTPTESAVWEVIRNRKLNGIKFYRQHPIIYETDRKKLHFFIADFYSNELKLVLEMDGKVHDHQKDYDKERDFIIDKLGIKVIRFKNDEFKDALSFKSKLIDLVTK